MLAAPGGFASASRPSCKRSPTCPAPSAAAAGAMIPSPRSTTSSRTPAGRARLEAVVLVDDTGCLVAGAGAELLCEELAAFAPLLADRKAVGNAVVGTRLAAIEPDVFVRAVSLDGVPALLCGRGAGGAARPPTSSRGPPTGAGASSSGDPPGRWYALPHGAPPRSALACPRRPGERPRLPAVRRRRQHAEHRRRDRGERGRIGSSVRHRAVRVRGVGHRSAGGRRARGPRHRERPGHRGAARGLPGLRHRLRRAHPGARVQGRRRRRLGRRSGGRGPWKYGLSAGSVIVPAEHVLLPEARMLPAIVIVDTADDEEEFVVAWRLDGDRVQVMDPREGRR